tara:strand:+ start:1905 stop:2621 length:717 start_codon:yes stop_codon:yes gene_type:complete
MGVLRVYDGSDWVGVPVATDHGSLSGLGDDDHPQYAIAVDYVAHDASSSVHFTEASIDHGSIAGLADNDHPQYQLSSTPQVNRGYVCAVMAGTAVTPTASLTYNIFASGTAVTNNGFTMSDTGSGDYYDDIVWQGGRTSTFDLSLKCTAKTTAAAEFEMRVIPYTYDGATEAAVTSTILYVGTPARTNSKNSASVAGCVTLNHGDSIRFKHGTLGSTVGTIDTFGIAATLVEVFSTSD